MQALQSNKANYSSGEKAILEAAEPLFAEKGFDAVSMSAIALLADTSKPNIYHHFKNKDDLYLAVMKTAVQRSSALLDSLEDAPGSHGQHLADFSAGQLKNILAHSRSTQLILRDALSGGSQHGRDIAKHVVGDVFTRIVAMVRSGQQDNEFRAGLDPALAAFMVVAANLFFFQAGPVMQHIPEANFSGDAEAFSKGVMDIMFNGLIKEGGNT
ncbi:MAG: TetR family transcriptional regulator [Xanthomonadales bacterium]|nr:TetR family transcriptional regulator [Xanthomonadales bacterium]